MGLIDMLFRSLRMPRVTENYPARQPAFTRGRRGTPELIAERCNADGACVRACPTNAIRLRVDVRGSEAWEIDYGACIFCGVCLDACPNEAITATDVFELAVRERTAAVAGHRIEARRG